MIGYKTLLLWDNWEKNFSPATANFSASNHLILGYSTGNWKEIMCLLMASPLIFSVWQVSWIFDFLMIFCKEFSVKFCIKEIQLILSILWVWHLKIVPKSEILSESIKYDTKATKTRVWNEPQPKLIHQHLALNKGILEVVLT